MTLGRQQVYLGDDELNKLKLEYCFKTDEQPEFGVINDKLLSDIISSRIASIDYSDYEGADIVHDLGLPIAEKYYNSYDMVIDGGTLEHVFNFPVAIANCMKVLKVGGLIFLFQMANNHMGHGFYQFSPELFYRIFSNENGFSVQNMYMIEHAYPKLERKCNYKCWEVMDPAGLNERIGLVNPKPVCMMVAAKKESACDIFKTNPVQSDYQTLYDGESVGAVSAKAGKTKTALKMLLPQRCVEWYYGRRELKRFSFSNGSFYRKVNW